MSTADEKVLHLRGVNNGLVHAVQVLVQVARVNLVEEGEQFEVEPLARFNSVAFIETLLRGTEWAATGDVKRAVPDDFPTADTISVRAP